MRPTLRHVAERAGVSEATVSRVVNDRPGVAEATRREVLRAMENLGYESTGLVRTATADAVGVVVPELDNPIFPAFAQELESRLARHGFMTLICSSTLEGIHEPDYLAALLDRGVAGLVIVSGLHADTTLDHSPYHRLAEQGVPLVLVNGAVDGLDGWCLSSDDIAAARLGVRHLVDLGHTCIGLATGPGRYLPAQRKLAGYRQGLEAAFGSADEDLAVESVDSVEGGHAAAVQLLQAGVTGVLAGSDLMAIGAVRAVREQGLRVPDDISIVGYDDISLVSHTDPPLTTLRQPVRAIGAAATTALVRSLHRVPTTPYGEYLFAAELIVRGSTGPAPPRTR
jgi:LacI family transcriptional regulator, repressor for deo operon, udp, cdd, tsx, nupC, and nupG